MKKFFESLKKFAAGVWNREPQRPRLLCMRADEMQLAHPDTDWSRICERCKQPVGIYPSGQEILKLYGSGDVVEIVCNRCCPPPAEVLNRFQPQAITETLESVKNPRFRKP